MYCDMFKIQDGVAIVEKLNYVPEFALEKFFVENFHNI